MRQAEGTNYETRGACRLANKDKQGFLGWTSNILNAVVFPSLSVAVWWLLSCSSLLFSTCHWTNCRLCPLRRQNPSCSNNCDVRACSFHMFFLYLIGSWQAMDLMFCSKAAPRCSKPHPLGWEMVFLYQVQYMSLIALGTCQFWLNKGLVEHVYPHEIST